MKHALLDPSITQFNDGLRMAREAIKTMRTQARLQKAEALSKGYGFEVMRVSDILDDLDEAESQLSGAEDYIINMTGHLF